MAGAFIALEGILGKGKARIKTGIKGVSVHTLAQVFENLRGLRREGEDLILGQIELAVSAVGRKIGCHDEPHNEGHRDAAHHHEARRARPDDAGEKLAIGGHVNGHQHAADDQLGPHQGAKFGCEQPGQR